MQIQIISVAQKPPAWVDSACDDYLRRLPREIKPDLVTIPLPSRQKKKSAAQQQARECELILAKMGAGGLNLALDESGQAWSSRDWSTQLERWMHSHPRVNLVIGGPDGLAPQCLDACRQRISLGRMTMPHALVRIVVLEQLYRAWTILRGHPYHRE